LISAHYVRGTGLAFDPLRRSVLNLTLHGRKLSSAILLATLALCAWFLARGTTSLIAGKLLPPQPVLAATSTAAVGRPPGAELPDYHAILKRNMFDPGTGPLWPPKPPPSDAPAEGDQAVVEAPEQLAPGQIPPPCEGNAKMISAIHSERYPEWSFATLTSGTDTPMLYRQGSKLDDKEIVAVLPKAVFLRQANGRLCSLVMFVDKATLQARAAAAPAAPPAGTAVPMPPMVQGGISEAEMDQNIKAMSETKFGVPRSFVDRILSNQAEILSSARVVPHEENGQVVGVKLYGIRRNSLLGKLGLQNGDLLRTINGFAMSSPDTALEAYTRLRTASNLAVAVVRRGQAMNIEYDISQ
jgi:general secretion pathway protein C